MGGGSGTGGGNSKMTPEDRAHYLTIGILLAFVFVYGMILGGVLAIALS